LIRQDLRRHFLRIAWEDICDSVKNLKAPDELKQAMTQYFINKTIGYDGRHRLRKDFDLSDAVTDL